MSNHGTNRQKIKAMNNGVNVTYIQLTNSQSNTHHVYDDEDDNEDTQYLIENIENDEDQIESENVHTESESNAAETIEILETVTIDQKRSVPKTTITKKLIERKSKKGIVFYCDLVPHITYKRDTTIIFFRWEKDWKETSPC